MHARAILQPQGNRFCGLARLAFAQLVGDDLVRCDRRRPDCDRCSLPRTGVELDVAMEGNLLMKKLWSVFGVAAILFFLVLAVSPLKNYLQEWKRYQAGYNQYVETLPKRVKPLESGIRQIWVQKMDRADRCTTCHLGHKEPALHNAPQPY